MQDRAYILSTAALSLFCYAVVIMVLYQVEPRFHLPAYNHISLDSKLHFLRHHADIKTADTLVIGSSMGLNNINGELLETVSSKVEKVVNLSAWSLKCPQLLPLLTQIVNSSGQVKRIIYAAQYFDFTGEVKIKGASVDTVFGYLNDEPLGTFKFIFSASKNLLSMLDQFLRWENFTNAKTYEYLVFDDTGGSLLNINQSNANPHRWGEIDAYTLTPLREEHLSCLQKLVNLAQARKLDLFFVVQPFRQALIKDNPGLKAIMNEFSMRTREIMNKDKTYHIDAHHLLNLDDANFADKSHLNILGANAKTRKLAEIIDQKDPVVAYNTAI